MGLGAAVLLPDTHGAWVGRGRAQLSGRAHALNGDGAAQGGSDFIGTVKGQSAIRVFNEFRQLKRRLYRGNPLWARGYCVDTVGLNEAKNRAYVRYRNERERRAEQRGWDF